MLVGADDCKGHTKAVQLRLEVDDIFTLTELGAVATELYLELGKIFKINNRLGTLHQVSYSFVTRNKTKSEQSSTDQSILCCI